MRNTKRIFSTFNNELGEKAQHFFGSKTRADWSPLLSRRILLCTTRSFLVRVGPNYTVMISLQTWRSLRRSVGRSAWSKKLLQRCNVATAYAFLQNAAISPEIIQHANFENATKKTNNRPTIQQHPKINLIYNSWGAKRARIEFRLDNPSFLRCGRVVKYLTLLQSPFELSSGAPALIY